MKKIILVFLILSLVSGCDKANTLKPIQLVKNQIVQSDDDQVSQSNNNQAVQLNNNQNTETNKQEYYSTSSIVAHMVGGAVIAVVLVLAGYVVYRHYRPVLNVVPANSVREMPSLLELRLGKFYTIDDIMMERLHPLDVKVLTLFEFWHYRTERPPSLCFYKAFDFLLSVYSARRKRLRRISGNLVPLLPRDDYDGQVRIMLGEFHQALADRRVLFGLYITQKM
jgi:hypothetical protein